MAVSTFDELLAHRGHEIEIGVYGPANDPANVAVECMDCGEVLFDFDAEP